HFPHRRLDTKSLRCHFYWIDRVVEFDANRRVVQRMIERAEPFHFERLGFTSWHHLQVRKWFSAFCVEQAIHDEVECVSDWKRCARCDSKPRCFQRPINFPFTRLNYFDRKTLARIARLKVNVLRRFIEANGIS